MNSNLFIKNQNAQTFKFIPSLPVEIRAYAVGGWVTFF